jgi:hypothetical protein
MEGVLHGRKYDDIIIPYSIDMVAEPSSWAIQ